MVFVVGLILIVVTIAMVVLARPANGVVAPFLRSWVIGQIYTMVALAAGVLGISLVLSDLPF
jgi:hypothetical protein